MVTVLVPIIVIAQFQTLLDMTALLNCVLLDLNAIEDMAFVW